MKNTLLAKTLTASLPGNPQDIFARISDPENLPQWHGAFCRSLRRDNGTLVAESPRGAVPIRFVRNDHSMVLDLFVEVKEGIELLNAIRLLSNGDGSEIIWTLVKAEGISDPIFHEQLRWAGSALHSLRKAPEKQRPEVPALEFASAEISQALQTPSSAEASSMSLSGKKLFIGNLSYDWTDEQLREHFAAAGTVTMAEVARFRGRGGRSRGFGFVEMGTEEQAQSAITKLHGVVAGGREIIVRIAKSQESRPAAPAAPVPPSQASSEQPSAPAEPNGNTIVDDKPEPGNELQPRGSSSRQRTERPRRGSGGRPRPSGSPPPARVSAGGSFARRIPGRSSGSGHSYHEVDITNKSGYEIFPRRAPGTPETPRLEDPGPARSSLESSPYMDDTGDIENHGRRPPPRRRRR